MPLKTKKQKLRKLLGALRPEEKTDLIAQELKEELAEIAERVDNAPDYKTSIEELRTGFKRIIGNITERIDGLVNKDELTKLESGYLNEISKLEDSLRKITLDVKTEVDEQFYQTRDTFSSDIDGVKKSLAKVRLELLNQLDQRGGNANRQINVKSSVMSTKYTDINFQNSDTVGWVVSDDDTNKRVNIQASVLSGGGGTPGGSDTQVQFNDGGSFGGDAGLTYNKTTDTLFITGDLGSTSNRVQQGNFANANIGASGTLTYVSVGTRNLTINNTGPAWNDTSSGYKTTLTAGDTTDSNKVATLPNATGTVALTNNPTDITVPDEAYGAGWDGSLEVPTKNALYDKIETIGSGGGMGIGSVISNANDRALLYVGTASVLAQTGPTVYTSSDSLYFDQTGTGNSQDTKAIFFKPTYSDGTVRTTFRIYAVGAGANTYPELIIGGTGASEAKIRIRSLTGAGETIYFKAADLDFTGVSGPIYLSKLYLANPGESPHTTEKLFVRSTGDIIGAGFEVAHYGANPQEIVYIHNNPWTGASSGGAMYTIRLRSDTTDWNLAANWTATWATATHASRKGRATFNVYDTAIREAIRIEASGSAPMVGFYGGAAVAKAAATTDLGTVLSDLSLRTAGTAYPITTSGAVSFTGTIGLGGQVTVSDGINFALNTTTGSKLGTAADQKLGLWNATPVVQPTALTTQLTSITHTAPGTPDYAIQDLVDSSGGAAFGFATKDEGNTVLSVIANLQTRVQELEDKLQSFGAIA